MTNRVLLFNFSSTCNILVFIICSARKVDFKNVALSFLRLVFYLSWLIVSMLENHHYITYGMLSHDKVRKCCIPYVLLD